MQRFFVDEPPQVAQVIDLAPLAHQLHTVLRLQPGAQIVLLDGRGNEFVTEIRSLERNRATGWPLTQRPAPGEPTIHLTLYQCSLKGDKFEWLLQKGTELGVARFVPVISERSVVRPAAALLKKYERWRTILREAAEQSGRGRIPELAPPLSWSGAIAHAEGMRLLPWEELRTANCGAQRAPRIADLLRPTTHSSRGALWATHHSVSLLIGPEGGITQNEAHTAQAAGWPVAALGPRILRAETAALVSITLVMEHLQQLSLPAQQTEL